MAKTKADYLKEAKDLGLNLNEKDTVPAIQSAIKNAEDKSTSSKKSTDKTEVELEATETAIEEPKTQAKAGKRSAKAVAETEEKIAKEERKAKKVEDEIEEATKPKQPVKPARSRLERRSKKFKEAAKLIDAEKLYTIKEATELATKTSPVKFDATVELHIRLGVDPRQADQNLRDSIVLPSGTGKTVRVAVFAEEDVAKDAKKAGADVAGYEDFLKQLDKGVIDFDILIATPNVMAKLSKYARILGPKGLMPNPKSGTVTNDVVKAITQSMAGEL